MNAFIREATAFDFQGVSEVVRAAFPGSQGKEIDELVFDLLADSTATPLISMVAEIDSRVIGHILFSHARVVNSPRRVTAKILAPLSVAPEYQGHGVGGQLIKEGLKKSMEEGTDIVFVLGHPGYYGRHGFVVSGANGFEAPHPIPAEHAEAWMVQGITAGIVSAASGRVVCADCLMDPKHWRG